MRSSDAWLGWPYDVHTFSMMTAFLLLTLRARRSANSAFANVKLGDLRLTTGSQHLYDRDRGSAIRCLDNEDLSWESPYVTPDLDELTHPDQLVERLWQLA